MVALIGMLATVGVIGFVMFGVLLARRRYNQTKKFDDFDLMELEAEFDKLPPELVAEMEAEFEETFADGVAPTTFDEIFGDL